MLRRALALVLTALLLAACADSVDEAALSPAAIAAEANIASLDFTGVMATTEMLDVRTGEVTALDEVVTGDRAVLLWYWAPD